MKKILIPFAVMLTLSGCGGGGGSESLPPTKDLIPFNLTGVVPIVGTTDIQLRWAQQPLTGVTYDLCLYDEDASDYCNALSTVQDTSTGIVTIDKLTDLNDAHIFVRAQYGLEKGFSNHLSVTADHIKVMFDNQLLMTNAQKTFIHQTMGLSHDESVEVTTGSIVFKDRDGNIELTQGLNSHIPAELRHLNAVDLEAHSQTTLQGETFDGRHFVVEWDDGSGFLGFSLLEFTGTDFISKGYFSTLDLGWRVGDISGITSASASNSGFFVFKTNHTDTSGIGGDYHTLTLSNGSYVLTNGAFSDLDPKNGNFPITSTLFRGGSGYATHLESNGSSVIRMFPTIGGSEVIAPALTKAEGFIADNVAQLSNDFVQGKLVLNQHYLNAQGGSSFDPTQVERLVVHHQFNLADLALGTLVGESYRLPTQYYIQNTLSEENTQIDVMNYASSDLKDLKVFSNNLTVVGTPNQAVWSQLGPSPITLP